jgi:3-hydroxyisobutyrate dehydrogenase-like beta-hydroxyacid dehydrogenase
MKIGFVGLGHMGLPMARNILKAGHDLAVFSSQSASVAALVAQGATQASSLSELVAGNTAICSCRVTPEQSREVFLGPDGVLGKGAPGTLCIDFSTVDPITSRDIAGQLRAAGHGFCDAPVSGGPNGAEARTLSVLVGASDGDWARAKPIFEALSDKLFHLGDVGAGVTAKLCNNLITGTVHVLLAEAMVFGTKAGIDPRRLYDVLTASTANSTTLQRVVPNHFLPRNFEPASALTTIIKDLECVLSTARALGVRMLLPASAQQCYIEAAGLGHGAKDLSAVILQMESIAGIQVGPA